MHWRERRPAPRRRELSLRRAPFAALGERPAGAAIQRGLPSSTPPSAASAKPASTACRCVPITEVAGVDLALANYHFGSKDNLLREVIARRARIVHDDRVRALEAARHDAGARSPSVEAIVAAFLEPLLRRLIGGDRGWRYYGSLASQLDVLPQFVDLTSEVLDPTALHFINALRLALPKARPRSIYWGYMFLIGSMVQVMSATGRIERLSRGLCRSDDIEGALRELVPFISAGLRALQSNPDDRSAGRKAAVSG